MSSWQISIHEPQGTTRHVSISDSTSLGYSEKADIQLKDPKVAEIAAHIFQKKTSFWIQIPDQAPPIQLGGLWIRASELIENMPFTIGDSKLVLEKNTTNLALPEVPSGIQPWFTCSELGKKLLSESKKVASTSLPVYLTGETGTGKEVLAHLIHAWSLCKQGPFVPVNCAAIPLSLAESELFGHLAGAFTGATKPRTGAFIQAHGGTLFLDEIGDLPLEFQVKLLRFLENGEIRPLGSNHTTHAKARIICATHLPLEYLVEKKLFREDLYYRIASIALKIPPLRKRPEDIAFLLQKFAADHNRYLSSQVLQKLQMYHWPGNTRQLKHAVQRACSIAEPTQLILNETDFDFLNTNHQVQETSLNFLEMKKVLVTQALKEAKGNRTQAAKSLGIARSTLYSILKESHMEEYQ
jgi:transcriptional regulator with PAS, ATPase and Fis domain